MERLGEHQSVPVYKRECVCVCECSYYKYMCRHMHTFCGSSSNCYRFLSRATKCRYVFAVAAAVSIAIANAMAASDSVDDNVDDAGGVSQLGLPVDYALCSSWPCLRPCAPCAAM